MALCFDSQKHQGSPVFDEIDLLFPEEGHANLKRPPIQECNETSSDDATVPSTLDQESNGAQQPSSGAFGEVPLPVPLALDRLNAYMRSDFANIDTDKDGRLIRKELEQALATMTNKDEIQMMSWMSKNMEALQHLGDRQSGVSLQDLEGLNRGVSEGTGDIGFAFRNTEWFGRAGASAAGGFSSAAVARTFFKIPVTSNYAMGWTLASFGMFSAVDLIGHYLFERPKIDRAINELNGLPDLTAEKRNST